MINDNHDNNTEHSSDMPAEFRTLGYLMALDMVEKQEQLDKYNEVMRKLSAADTETPQPAPTAPILAFDPALQQRAHQLAGLPEVKAAFAGEVLAMTDGRWLRLVELLSPDGELATYISDKPKAKRVYVLAQALCDEGWIAGDLTTSDAKPLGLALSRLMEPQMSADELTRLISKGKGEALENYRGEIKPIKHWDELTQLSRSVKEAAKHILEMLSCVF